MIEKTTLHVFWGRMERLSHATTCLDIPLSFAALADLALAEGQREAAIELVNQTYAVADAAPEQRGTKRQLGPRASATRLAQWQ